MDRDEANPDLVGRTSARLLAAGVDRRERLAALHLLAVLDASTDANGRIRRPLDDLAAEFELAPLSVLRSLDHLEHAGALARDGAAVVLLGARDQGLGGMDLADFLDDVRASFDDDRADRRPRSRWLARAGGALVATAAAVAVFAVAPSTQPAVEQRLAIGSSTTIAADEAADGETEPTTSTFDSRPAPVTEPAAASPDSTVVVAEACPAQSPIVELVENVIRMTNPTDHDVVVTGIRIGERSVTTPIALAPGETIELPVAPGVVDVDPTLDGWEWREGDMARTCPS